MKVSDTKREEVVCKENEPFVGWSTVSEDNCIDELVIVDKNRNEDLIWLNKTVQKHACDLSKSTTEFTIFQKNIANEILLKLIVTRFLHSLILRIW